MDGSQMFALKDSGPSLDTNIEPILTGAPPVGVGYMLEMDLHTIM